MAKSRRKAREAALQALYKIEISKSPIVAAIEELRDHSDLSPDMVEYAERVVNAVRQGQADYDGRLSAIIKEYDYDRVAVVDKNVLRIAAYELLNEPSIPPAVTINEAIEISRKFSTYESGKFVNGILGKLLEESPKANWDPAAAPSEETEEAGPKAEPIEVVEENIDADSDEVKKLARIAGWKLRGEDAPS